MLTGKSPFARPTVDDPNFVKLFVSKDYSHVEMKSDAMDLLSKILCPMNERYHLKDILQHPWMLFKRTSVSQPIPTRPRSSSSPPESFFFTLSTTPNTTPEHSPNTSPLMELNDGKHSHFFAPTIFMETPCTLPFQYKIKNGETKVGSPCRRTTSLTTTQHSPFGPLSISTPRGGQTPTQKR